MATYFYARVSTNDQRLDLQMDSAKKEGIDPSNIFSDEMSGTKADRPGLKKMMARLKQGDEVIVWKLDRLMRSTVHLSALMEEFGKIGVKFRSITEPFFDTTSSQGKFIFTMFGALAQMERDNISERTKAGLLATKARGTKLGRPRGLSEESMRKASQAKDLYLSGTMTTLDICKTVGIGSKKTLYRWLDRLDVEIGKYEPRKPKED